MAVMATWIPFDCRVPGSLIFSHRERREGGLWMCATNHMFVFSLSLSLIEWSKHLVVDRATSLAQSRSKHRMEMVRLVRQTRSMVRRSSPVPPPPCTMAMGRNLATNRTPVRRPVPPALAAVVHCRKRKIDYSAKRISLNRPDVVWWTEWSQTFSPSQSPHQ